LEDKISERKRRRKEEENEQKGRKKGGEDKGDYEEEIKDYKKKWGSLKKHLL